MPALRYFASFPGTQLVWGKVHKSVFSSLQGAINMDKAGGGLMNDPCTSTSLCLDRRSPGGHLISLQSGLLQRLRSPNNRPHPFVRFPFLSFVFAFSSLYFLFSVHLLVYLLVWTLPPGSCVLSGDVYFRNPQDE